MDLRLAIGLLALAGGCSGDKDGDTTPTGPVSVTVATYNAGLAVGFVPGAESRTPLVADAVAGIDADVVCLQEVWLPEQVAAVEAATSSVFPSQYAPAAQQSSDASCAPGQLDSLVGCIADSCGDACVDEVVDCVFGSCPFQFVGLPQDCMRCAMANVGEDPEVVASSCEDAPVEFAYGGSFGTVLLSKRPLENVTEHVFSSTTNRRSVISAEVDFDGKRATVMCTHLTAVFDTIPYPRTPGSWAEEQLAQVEELNAMAAAIDGPVVLLGDLNTGVSGDGVKAEAPESLNALLAAGWDDPYRSLDGRCTFCSTNPLIVGADDDDNRLIDHVLLQGEVEATGATRILDQTVSAESCAYDLSTSALSDHYGVSVTLEL
ncbi:MAG: endonuclease/exonuclease/phosphatase family protein [Myxococcota bacterium]